MGGLLLDIQVIFGIAGFYIEYRIATFDYLTVSIFILLDALKDSILIYIEFVIVDMDRGELKKSGDVDQGVRNRSFYPYVGMRIDCRG